MNRKVKDKILVVLYILTAVFWVVWSAAKYKLGINKNFFFAQFAVIGVVMLFFSIAVRFVKSAYSGRISGLLDGQDYEGAARLIDKYIQKEKPTSETYLGRAFIAMLYNDSEKIEEILAQYSKHITDEDKYIINLVSAAIMARKGDIVSANQHIDSIGFNFSAAENKDFYISLSEDLRDYCSALTALSQSRTKTVRSIIRKREKNTLAGAYKQIMDLLWEKLENGQDHVLKETGEKESKGIIFDRYIRVICFYLISALVLCVPSSFNLKDDYDTLRDLTDNISFFNEVSCAYGNSELYYVKYYDFNGNYNDLVFKVEDEKYRLLSDEETFTETKSGVVQSREIGVSLYKTDLSESGVLVIEERTIDAPAGKVTYNNNLAFTVLLEEDVQSYAAHLGLYDGSLDELSITFDWGEVDVSVLN